MIQIGATVGNYQVLEQIGAGAMGAVFLAAHPVIGKRVALKVIHPELAGNEEMVMRFFNEARAVTQIGHQNIVDVQDFGQTPDGDSFMVMELLEGVSLGNTIKRDGALAVPRATHIALQMAEGLAAAHARGIIHRDLKPDNIFLIARNGDPDFVKILDFGLAKLSGPGQALQRQTKTGSLLGTPHYMAPEQAENVKKVDHRADVYSLGCILFQMLIGRVPFPGNGFGEVLVRHVREPPPLLSRLNPAVPQPLEKIVLHALAKKPEFRFGSMSEFAAALRDPARFAQQLEGSAVRLTPDAGVPTVSAAPAQSRGTPALNLSAPRASHEAPTVLGVSSPAEIQELRRAADNAREERRQAAAAQRPAARSPSGPTVQAPRPVQAAEPAPRSWRWVWLLALPLAAAAAAAVWYFALGPGRGGHVAITVQTTPLGAEVLEAGQSLGQTPLVLRLERSSEPRTLAFRKEGFVIAQRRITPSANQEVSVRLLPKPPAEPSDDAPPPVQQEAAGNNTATPPSTGTTPPATMGTQPPSTTGTPPPSTGTPPPATTGTTPPSTGTTPPSTGTTPPSTTHEDKPSPTTGTTPPSTGTPPSTTTHDDKPPVTASDKPRPAHNDGVAPQQKKKKRKPLDDRVILTPSF